MNNIDPIERPKPSNTLSPREIEIVHLASHGYSDKQIATALSISKFTVASHWQNILIKNGAVNRTLVIARYSTALARNEVESEVVENLVISAPIRSPRSCRVNRSLKRNLEQAILDCSVRFTKGLVNHDDVFRRYLQEAVVLTDSTCGFLCGVRPDEDDNPSICATAIFNLNVGEVQPVVITGWNEVNPQASNIGLAFETVFSTLETYISNEDSPKHNAIRDLLRVSRLESFVIVPIMNDKFLVGLLCLANRPGGYADDVVHFLEPMITSCTAFIEGWLAEVDRIAMDRKITDVALMLKTVTDGLQSAFLYESREGVIMYYNQALLDVLGLKGVKTDFVGRPTSQLFDRSISVLPEPSSFTNCIESIISCGDTRFGFTVALAENHLYNLDFIVARERDAVKGNIWKFAELSHEQLQSSAFKQIAGQARDAIILIDKDGSVQYWNTHAESIFGFASSEVIGKPLVDLIIPERYKESHLAGLAHYSKTRESRVMGQLIDITGRRKDGEEVQIELMLSCVDPGDDPRYCAFIRERLS